MSKVSKVRAALSMSSCHGIRFYKAISANYCSFLLNYASTKYSTVGLHLPLLQRVSPKDQ